MCRTTHLHPTHTHTHTHIHMRHITRAYKYTRYTLERSHTLIMYHMCADIVPQSLLSVCLSVCLFVSLSLSLPFHFFLSSNRVRDSSRLYPLRVSRENNKKEKKKNVEIKIIFCRKFLSEIDDSFNLGTPFFPSLTLAFSPLFLLFLGHSLAFFSRAERERKKAFKFQSVFLSRFGKRATTSREQRDSDTKRHPGSTPAS